MTSSPYKTIYSYSRIPILLFEKYYYLFDFTAYSHYTVKKFILKACNLSITLKIKELPFQEREFLYLDKCSECMKSLQALSQLLLHTTKICSTQVSVTCTFAILLKFRIKLLQKFIVVFMHSNSNLIG